MTRPCVASENRDVPPSEHEQEHAGLEVRDAGVRDALVLAQVRLDQFADSGNELPSFTSCSVTATTSASTSRVPRRATRPCRGNARSSTALRRVAAVQGHGQHAQLRSRNEGRSLAAPRCCGRNEDDARRHRRRGAERRGGRLPLARTTPTWRAARCTAPASCARRRRPGAAPRDARPSPSSRAEGASSEASRVTRGAPPPRSSGRPGCGRGPRRLKRAPPSAVRAARRTSTRPTSVPGARA